MKKKWLVLLLILSIIYSCNSRINSVSSSSDSKKLTIIVRNSNKINTNIGSGINASNFKKIDINTKQISDTILLDFNFYLKLYIRNDNFFKTVICKKGDTLILDIKKYNTKVIFSNRQLAEYDTISVKSLYQLNIQKYNSKYNKLFKKFMSIDENKRKIEPNIKYIRSNLNEFKKFNEFHELRIKTKKNVLNKLKKEQLISMPNYINELSQLDYKHFIFLTKNYRFSLDKFYLKKIEKKYIKNKLIFSDPFISYGYLNSYIINVVLNNENSRINTDYKKAYDLLPNFLKTENLKLFREFCLHQMIQQKESINDVLKYFNHYTEQYRVNCFSESFKQKYLLEEKKEIIRSNSVELVQYNTKKTSLNKVIESHKNKLIYVDFWASWCVPCRLEMMKSKKIRGKLESKNIVFIYLSIDTDKDKWLKASKEEGLPIDNNYLALNYPQADFYKELNLKSIPRYIIYDRNGNIIHQDAPRPSDDKILDLFSSILMNN